MDKIDLQINKNTIIPNQDLEGKIARISKIVNIFTCDSLGNETDTDYGKVNIKIWNKYALGRSENDKILLTNGIENNQIYSMEEYKKFLEGYAVNSKDPLLGELVISIYTNPGYRLTGLIPINIHQLLDY